MNKQRILIVDDEESVLFVLKNSLRKLGDQFQIVTATDGLRALEQLRQNPFDLVVTDYRMNGMDGLQLMAAVHDIQPKARVILMTAYGNDSLKSEAEKLQAYRYLTKPLDIVTFRQIVQEALRGDVAVSRPGILILSDQPYRQALKLLTDLRTEVGARCIILTDANGQAIAQAGDLVNLPVAEIASLLSGSMATLQAAGQALDQDANAINLSYREGQRDNLYVINIGQQLLLILVIENSAYSSRLGSVWYYARQTAVSLRKTIGEAEYATAPQLFDEHMDQAFATELDKLFGDDDDDGFGETFMPPTQPTRHASTTAAPNAAAPAAQAPAARTPAATMPVAAAPVIRPIASSPPPPPSGKLVTFADAVALGLIPGSVIEQE